MSSNNLNRGCKSIRSKRRPRTKAASSDYQGRELLIEPLESRTLLAGMPMLLDIGPGNNASYPNYFTNVNNTVFFVATHPTQGKELWKTDGTVAGTALVKDIYPGLDNSSNPHNLTNVNATPAESPHH